MGGPPKNFSDKNPPLLNTWVTVCPGPGQRTKRDRLAASIPALVSCVNDQQVPRLGGTVTVIYPNELVLSHGFRGSPLKREAGVPFSRLRPLCGGASDLSRLHSLLLDAVRGAAAAAASVAAAAAAAAGQESVPEDAGLMQPPDDEAAVAEAAGTEAEEAPAADAEGPHGLCTPQRRPTARFWDPSPLCPPSEASAGAAEVQAAGAEAAETPAADAEGAEDAEPPATDAEGSDAPRTPRRFETETTAPSRRRMLQKRGSGDKCASHGSKPAAAAAAPEKRTEGARPKRPAEAPPAGEPCKSRPKVAQSVALADGGSPWRSLCGRDEKAFTAAVAQAFTKVDVLPLRDLLDRLKVSWPEKDARERLASLENAQKVMVADDLVFRLA